MKLILKINQLREICAHQITIAQKIQYTQLHVQTMNFHYRIQKLLKTVSALRDMAAVLGLHCVPLVLMAFTRGGGIIHVRHAHSTRTRRKLGLL